MFEKLWPVRAVRPLVGLDIQAQFIRLLALKKNRKNWHVQVAQQIELSHGIVVDGRIRQWETFASRLTDAVQQAALVGAPAGVVLPSSLVRLLTLQLPVGLAPSAIEAEIAAQVERDYPGMRNELCIDYSVDVSNDANYMDIVYVIAKQDYIQQLVGACEKSGLLVRIIDIDIYALARVLNFLLRNQAAVNGINAMVTIIADCAWLLVCQQQKILFQRRFQFEDTKEFYSQLQQQLIQTLMNTDETLLGKLIILGAAAAQQSNFVAISQHTHFAIEFPEFLPVTEQSGIVDFILAGGVAMREKPKW